jgi:hypothetical protein
MRVDTRLNIETRENILPGLPKMTANTALGIGLAGVSLWLWQRKQANRQTRPRFASSPTTNYIAGIVRR